MNPLENKSTGHGDYPTLFGRNNNDVIDHLKSDRNFSSKSFKNVHFKLNVVSVFSVGCFSFGRWCNMKLLITLVAFCLVGSTVQECPFQCECTDHKVKCSLLTDGSIADVLRRLPTNSTKKLDLSKNVLTSFNMALLKDFTKLETLILNENKLSSVPSRISHHVPSLKKLHIRHNSLLRNLTKQALEGAFNLEVLDVKDSSISNLLHNGIFYNNSKMTVLNLASNKIVAMEKNVFVGLRNLVQLDLNNNRISDLRPGTFKPLTSIQHILINSNNLIHIHNQVFTGLKSVKLISLIGNQLKALGSEAFQSLPNVTTISLADNSLQSFSKTAFKYSYIHKEIDLRGNPIHCSCFIASFELKTLKSQGKLNGACMTPLQFTGRSLKSITRNELGCTTCDFNECKNNATCIIKDDYYFCQCLQGYEGKFCQTVTEDEDSTILWVVILIIILLVAVICSLIGWWYYRKQKGLSFCVITKTQCCCCCFISVVIFCLLLFFTLRIVSYMYEHS